VLDAGDAPAAVAELATPMMGFKAGRMVFRRQPVEIFPPK